MKRFFTILLLCISLIMSAKTTDMTAIFIYQFTKLIEWPDSYKSGMFRIGVLGSFDTYKEVSNVTLGRNVGNQNIEVMNIVNRNLISLTNYHIIVVGDEFCTSENIKYIHDQLKGKPTLIISNKLNYKCPGICVGFENSGGGDSRYFFEQKCIEAKGLKCSRDFIQWGRRDD